MLKPETEIIRQTPWSRIRGHNSVNKEFLEIVGSGKSTGSVLKETNAVSGTIWISVQNRHSRILLPRSSTRQNVRNASRTRSVRGRSPSGRMSRWPCKDYLKGTCNNSFCEKWYPPECLFCSYAHRQVDEQPSKRSKKNGDKSAVAMLKIHDNWVAYFKIWSRRSLHRVCGRGQTYGNQSDVFKSQKPSCVMLTFETKIHRLEWFAQVNLISVAPMLQNLRIGLRRR